LPEARRTRASGKAEIARLDRKLNFPRSAPPSHSTSRALPHVVRVRRRRRARIRRLPLRYVGCERAVASGSADRTFHLGIEKSGGDARDLLSEEPGTESRWIRCAISSGSSARGRRPSGARTRLSRSSSAPSKSGTRPYATCRTRSTSSGRSSTWASSPGPSIPVAGSRGSPSPRSRSRTTPSPYASSASPRGRDARPVFPIPASFSTKCRPSLFTRSLKITQRVRPFRTHRKEHFFFFDFSTHSPSRSILQ
jgi:hypothetical protein